MTIVFRGAAAALAVLALCAGCASVPSSAPSEPTSSAPSAAPEPTTPTPTASSAPEPTATGILVTAATLSIKMSDGTTGQEFSYWEPVGAVVDEFTDVFGAPPAVSAHAPAHHTPRFTEYAWDGARVLDWDTPVDEFLPDWAVQAHAPLVNGVEISTIDGVRAGDSGHDIEAAYPELSWRATPTGFPERIDARLGSVPIELTEDEWASSGMPRTGDSHEGYAGPTEMGFAVFVSAAAPDWRVRFTAPVDNFGP